MNLAKESENDADFRDKNETKFSTKGMRKKDYIFAKFWRNEISI